MGLLFLQPEIFPSDSSRRLWETRQRLLFSFDVFQGWNKYLSKHRLAASIQDTVVAICDMDTEVNAKNLRQNQAFEVSDLQKKKSRKQKQTHWR